MMDKNISGNVVTIILQRCPQTEIFIFRMTRTETFIKQTDLSTSVRLNNMQKPETLRQGILR